MVKTRRPAMMSGYEFHIRRQSIGLDLRTFAAALDVTISVASKLQTGRSPVNREVAAYLQSVEDAVEQRIALEFTSLDNMKVGDLKRLVLITTPPSDWQHGPGTWVIVTTRLRHMIHAATGVSPPLEERPDPAEAETPE